MDFSPTDPQHISKKRQLLALPSPLLLPPGPGEQLNSLLFESDEATTHTTAPSPCSSASGSCDSGFVVGARETELEGGFEADNELLLKSLFSPEFDLAATDDWLVTVDSPGTSNALLRLPPLSVPSPCLPPCVPGEEATSILGVGGALLLCEGGDGVVGPTSDFERLHARAACTLSTTTATPLVTQTLAIPSSSSSSPSKPNTSYNNTTLSNPSVPLLPPSVSAKISRTLLSAATTKTTKPTTKAGQNNLVRSVDSHSIINGTSVEEDPHGDFASDLKTKELSRNVKNAVAARQNRMKKKKYVQGLEDEASSLRTENAALLDKCGKMERALVELDTEVRYLRDVLANQSALSKLLEKIPDVKGLRLGSALGTGGGCRKRSRGEEVSGGQQGGEISAPCPKRLPPAQLPSTSGGVCLHVAKDTVSIEFCASCSRKHVTDSASDTETSF